MTTPEPTAAGRRRRLLALLAVVVVLGGGLAGVLAYGAGSKPAAKPATLSSVPPDVQADMTTIPASTFAQVGAGNALSQGVPLVTGAFGSGKPTVLFISAQFCPFCAGQRWALVAALSRFGTFSDLRLSHSSEYDIATFSFLHAMYRSPYLNFVGRDVEDQNRRGLQRLTAAQVHTWERYLAPGDSTPSFPFIDFAGRYVSVNDTVDVSTMLGQSATEIANQVRDPSTAISKTVIGAANLFTAAMCAVTDQQPTSVCTPGIQALADRFPEYRH